MFVTRAFLEKRQLPCSDRLFESTGVLVFYPLLVPTPFDTFKTYPGVSQIQRLWSKARFYGSSRRRDCSGTDIPSPDLPVVTPFHEAVTKSTGTEVYVVLSIVLYFHEIHDTQHHLLVQKQ